MIFLKDISKKWHETFVLNIHDHHRCWFFPVSKTRIFLVHFFLFMNIANISLFGTSFCALPTAKMIQKMFLCSIIIDWMRWYHGFKRKRKHLRAYINQSLLKVSPKKLKKVGRVQVHSPCSRNRAQIRFQTRQHVWVELIYSLLSSERFFPANSGSLSPNVNI